MNFNKRRNCVLFLSLIITSCIQLDDSVINEEKYLGNKSNVPGIYSTPGNTTFLNPFNLDTDNWGAGNIKCLMLVDFKALSNYISIELQVVEKEGKTGALVILYYQDGTQADVYHTPELELSTEMYRNVLNKTVLTQTNIQYHFEEIEGKLVCELHMIDRWGNNIEVDIRERLGEMQPVGMLAPIGGNSEIPKFMTIVFMNQFKFLSKNEKEILVKINGDEAELAKLPVRINGIKGFQTKYSMDPVTVSWNINFEGSLQPVSLTGPNQFYKNNIEITTINNAGHIEIKQFSGIQKNHKINFRFSPAIPNLQRLKNNLKVSGKFSMSVDNTAGIIAGKYSISKQIDKIKFIIQPTEGYSPLPGKAWMKKMNWKAEISKKSDGKYHMSSAWKKE